FAVMEDPVVQEDANIKAINEEYRRAFIFINKGLNTDELGKKEEARCYYKQGLDHLLRGVSIPLQGPACVGSQWESARQMQQKMRETLRNVRARLGILEQNTPPVQASPAAMDAPAGVPKLYPPIPSKEKPERPHAPNSVFVPSQPPAADGSVATVSQGQVPAMSPSSAKPLRLPNEAPPAYTPQATNGHFTVSYGTDSGEFSSVGEDYYSKCTQPPPLENLGVDADELILIPQGVQIFFVTPDGQVSAPSYPGYLRIVKFLDTDCEMAQSRPPAFLQVCDWLYPLMCNQSPVLCCNTGVYMFPDTMSQIPGSYVGVVLSSELPAADRELFEDLLKQMSDLRIQPSEASSDAVNLPQTVHIQPQPEGAENQKELPEWSEKVAHGILSGTVIRRGLSDFNKYESARRARRLGCIGCWVGFQNVNSIETSSSITSDPAGAWITIKKLSMFEGVCSIASCVGKELAPHVKKHGSKLVPESLKKDKDGKSTFDGALVVAASGVQGKKNALYFLNCVLFNAKNSNKLFIFTGFSTVWQGLESAAKCIAKSVSTETVKTVKYKYGDDAGHATDNAVNSAINVGVTAFNIDNIGIKAVVKRTAKETGHAVLDEYKVLDNEKKDKK
ncbi:SPART protein, partial [Pandion haliaetus]|nr:SPART protein [Pandion haliaetus]